MKDRRKIICIVVMVIIFVFSYLLINRFSFINDPEALIPTGNVDIFEISCDCCRVEDVNDVPETSDSSSSASTNNGTYSPSNSDLNSHIGFNDEYRNDSRQREQNLEPKNDNKSKTYDSKDNEGFNDDDKKEPNDNDTEKKNDNIIDNVDSESSDSPEESSEEDLADEDEEEDDPSIGHGEVVADDDYKVWDDMNLRIFSNPAFEFRNVVAPGSKNSYAFVVRNNNDFDILFDLIFKEDNINNINLRYKLRSNGSYLIGSEDEYVSIADKKINKIRLSAGSYQSFILDWMWVDSDNDALVGFNPSSSYKLSIEVASR